MIKNIFWDFDGVIIDSMKIRDYGFRAIFSGYSKAQVEKLIDFHRENGGLSRYVKIKYFFEDILKKPVTDSEINELANKFSLIMRKELVNPEVLISETISFIEKEYKKTNFHIVSGSDGNELRFLCDMLGLSQMFISIHGSPTPKKELVKSLFVKHNYQKSQTILIGDSINDYEAACDNEISFYGYNNPDLLEYSDFYVNTFTDFKIR